MDQTRDYLVRALAAGGTVRVLAARTTDLVEEARRRHQTTPTATAALGRALTAGALLGALLKGRERVTLRILGDGPLGGIVVDAGADGRVRGYVKQPRVLLPLAPGGKLDVGRAVGRRGSIHVTRDLGLKEPYTSSGPLVSGEIGEDLTHYFARSEQTPSAVSLGVLVDPGGAVRAAGGLLVQLLPGWGPEAARLVEANLAGLDSISRAIDRGATPEDLVELALSGVEGRTRERQPLLFSCRCSRDRSSQLLLSLGHDELADMLRSDGGAELRCRFCAEMYRFDRDELGALLAAARALSRE